MAPYRQILAEITRALMVLALVFFGLSQGVAASEVQVGPSPAVAASIAQTAASDFCGGGWGDHQTAHAPCHACRSTASLLPPPPFVVEPVAFVAVDLTRVEPVAVVLGRPPYGQSLSRAPPVA